MDWLLSYRNRSITTAAGIRWHRHWSVTIWRGCRRGEGDGKSGNRWTWKEGGWKSARILWTSFMDGPYWQHMINKIMTIHLIASTRKSSTHSQSLWVIINVLVNFFHLLQFMASSFSCWVWLSFSTTSLQVFFYLLPDLTHSDSQSMHIHEVVLVFMQMISTCSAIALSSSIQMQPVTDDVNSKTITSTRYVMNTNLLAGNWSNLWKFSTA